MTSTRIEARNPSDSGSAARWVTLTQRSSAWPSAQEPLPAHGVATASPSENATAAPPAAQQLTRCSKLKNLFFRTVRKEVIKQGLSPAVGHCIVGKLRASITKSEFKRIFRRQQPRSVTMKAKQAGAQCATA